jgi:hypothetical protein
MEERREEMEPSQSGDRSSQETPKKHVALTEAKYVDNKKIIKIFIIVYIT